MTRGGTDPVTDARPHPAAPLGEPGALPAALEVSGLCAGYPSRRTGQPPKGVLEGIDLAVPAGSLLAVLGPSGCGKTTLLRVVAGLLPATDGRVTVRGRVVVEGARGVPPERRHIGLVPQDAALFPHRDVEHNVEFGLRSRHRRGRRLGRTQRRHRVAEMLDLVGLPDLGRRYPHELSGGQRQRVALARALAPAPDLVLLDEPFAALDAALRTDLRAEVRQILREAGTTTVLVTHDQDEALSTADDVVVLRDGQIVQHDTPAALYARPVDAWVARFVGDCTILAGISDGTTVDCALGRVPAAAPAGPVELVVRPEQVRVSGEAADPVAPADGGVPRESGRATEGVVAPPDRGVSGVVTGREFFGHDTLLRLRLDHGPDLTARLAGPVSQHVGDRVRVGLQGAVHALVP